MTVSVNFMLRSIVVSHYTALSLLFSSLSSASSRATNLSLVGTPITTSPHEKTRTMDPNSGGSSKPKPNPRISYRECLKNHAASIGGTVTDGCGEFMPSGDEGTLEALKCAACNCHRNFHRKEHHLQLLPPLQSPSVVQPVNIAFRAGGCAGGSVGTESSSEELNYGAYHSNAVAPPPPPPHFSAKKRSRTKFTAEQKEKMMAFAEKLGWRLPREDDSEMQRFCAEVGLKRQVFKVWMHNNKTSTTSTKTIPDQQF